jgi:hypothetical protein
MTELDRAAGAIAHSRRLGDRRFPMFLRSIGLEKPCELRLCRLGGRSACSRRSPVFSSQGYFKLERFLAKRMNATTIELASSHVSLLSHPREIADLILSAAGHNG